MTIPAHSARCCDDRCVLRSFEPDEGVACVLLVDNMSETILRGSDRMTIARLACGEPIQFGAVRDGPRSCMCSRRVRH